MERRLYRSESDRMIAGVCGGLGAYFDIDPTLVRLIFAGAFLLGFGSPGLLYLLLWIVMPLQSRLDSTPRQTMRDGVQEVAQTSRGVVKEVRNQMAELKK